MSTGGCGFTLVVVVVVVGSVGCCEALDDFSVTEEFVGAFGFEDADGCGDADDCGDADEFEALEDSVVNGCNVGNVGMST